MKVIMTLIQPVTKKKVSWESSYIWRQNPFDQTLSGLNGGFAQALEMWIGKLCSL
jgi:hypothetical protein